MHFCCLLPNRAFSVESLLISPLGAFSFCVNIHGSTDWNPGFPGERSTHKSLKSFSLCRLIYSFLYFKCSEMASERVVEGFLNRISCLRKRKMWILILTHVTELPAHCRRVGLNKLFKSLWTQPILWFYFNICFYSLYECCNLQSLDGSVLHYI